MPNAYFRFAVAWCLLILLLGVRAKNAQSETIRFLVTEFGEAVHHDSYVLPLSDPDDIAHARRLIAEGPEIGAPLAVAKIAKGANGINRNYLVAGSPPWSWHVSAFEGFADFTVEILDGWPTFVEDDIDGWIANTNSYVGFWTYTVTAELPPGDYDADLDVDTDDYHVWRAGFTGTTELSADGNGDGIVDAADYAVWRKNLGTSITLPSQTASATSVPEPATLHLAWICGVLLYFSAKSRASLHELEWLNDLT
jgi:hypothetical protein